MPMIVAGLAISAIGALASGNVCAATTTGGPTAVYAGLSLIDLVLIILGAIVVLGGLWLKHLYVLVAGIVMVVLGALASYMGL